MPTLEWAIKLVTDELRRAEAKFPLWPKDYIHAAAIVAEEAGELVRAALKGTYENGGRAAMSEEAVQTAAMALRFLCHLAHGEARQSEQAELTLVERGAGEKG
jgi:NTP pyrophosphatase (non-canonical NTP hydrolase)